MCHCSTWAGAVQASRLGLSTTTAGQNAGVVHYSCVYATATDQKKAWLDGSVALLAAAGTGKWNHTLFDKAGKAVSRVRARQRAPVKSGGPVAKHDG